MNSKHKNDPDYEMLSTCSQCGLKMTDDQPRGFWMQNNAMGVYCITCAEADQESVKFGTPKTPIVVEDEHGIRFRD